jgi:hypothetical protein
MYKICGAQALWVLLLLCFLAYTGYQVYLSYLSYTNPDWCVKVCCDVRSLC